MTDASEQHRHRCEVRTLLRAIAEPGRGRAWVRDYLDSKPVAGLMRGTLAPSGQSQHHAIAAPFWASNCASAPA